MTQYKVTTVKVVQSAKEASELIEEGVFGQSVRTVDESGEKEITLVELQGRAENEGVEPVNGPTDEEVAAEKAEEEAVAKAAATQDLAPEAPGEVSNPEASAPAPAEEGGEAGSEGGETNQA